MVHIMINMSINELYQELIIDHGTSPRNFFHLENANAQAESYNPLCGDKIILFLSVKEHKITQASFQGHGCAISTASASIMTEMLIGKTIEEASQLFIDFTNTITENNNRSTQTPPSNNHHTLPDKLLALIGVKNYPSRVKCATLAWHTLQAAVKDKNL